MTWLLQHAQWLLDGLRSYAIPFVIVLGVVVLFHEFGHYLVAKLCGITVEVFSVGFGPRIAGFRRGGTDYRISWVPLGGYVKLKGEMPNEGGAPPERGDLLSRPPWQRFLVFVMGAVFNLITAFAVLTGLFMTGMEVDAYESRPPVVGEIDPNSPAQESGMRVGDRILSFGGQPVSTWKELLPLVLFSPDQTKEVVLEREGKRIATQLRLQASRNDIGVAGFYPETGVMVAVLQPGWPAEKAGLKRGDRIVSIDGVPMTTPARLVSVIQGAAGKTLRFTIERRGATFETPIVPVENEGRGRVGFQPDSLKVVRSYPLFEAMAESVRENLKSAGLIFFTFKKLLKHELSLRAFSGPIDIYRISGQAAREGLTPFLQLIALVSLQLGIINLFPIPPLDGGHVFTILIEGVIRRELSAQIKERVMQAGLILLLIFMGTIIYFDITKNFFR